jgi:hypothetical protein
MDLAIARNALFWCTLSSFGMRWVWADAGNARLDVSALEPVLPYVGRVIRRHQPPSVVFYNLLSVGRGDNFPRFSAAG